MKQKTAMQELIDELTPILDNNQFDFSYKAGISSAISKAQQLLEKEKEQIMNAYEKGYLVDWTTDFKPIEYYNKTYKQD